MGRFLASSCSSEQLAPSLMASLSTRRTDLLTQLFPCTWSSNAIQVGKRLVSTYRLQLPHRYRLALDIYKVNWSSVKNERGIQRTACGICGFSHCSSHRPRVLLLQFTTGFVCTRHLINPVQNAEFRGHYISRSSKSYWGRDGRVIRLLASHQVKPSSRPARVTPGYSQVRTVPNNTAGRWVFSEISRFPLPCILVILHSHLISHSSALKNSLLKVTIISQLNSKPLKNEPLQAGPIVTKHGADITAGNTANEVFIVETLDQEDVQRWGRAVRRHTSTQHKDLLFTRPDGSTTVVSEEILAALNSEVLRADAAEVSAANGKSPRKTRRLAALCGTIPTCENPGVGETNLVDLDGRRVVYPLHHCNPSRAFFVMSVLTCVPDCTIIIVTVACRKPSACTTLEMECRIHLAPRMATVKCEHILFLPHSVLDCYSDAQYKV
ncbi:hypothetical protein PR048_015150 [Dryococelus australis]|uniref:Uncharacterized protein n=1 Tax=Dryococelus australis TaxID=614101 RepID=A0ABQ9HG43_9NEOP|nr:hypothetical protein PR048_015150 [Dryococelus australis]